MIVYGNDGKKVFCKEGTYEIIDSFNDVLKVKDNNGTYTVKLVYNEGHDVIPDWVQGSGKPPVPPLGPNTLRIAFSNPSSDPTIDTHGIWTKVGSYGGYDNVWNYTSTDFGHAFEYLPRSLDQDIRVIETGDLSGIKTFNFCAGGATRICNLVLPSAKSVYFYFDTIAEKPESLEIDGLDLPSATAIYLGYYIPLKVGNINAPNCSAWNFFSNTRMSYATDVGEISLKYGLAKGYGDTAGVVMPNLVNFGGFVGYFGKYTEHSIYGDDTTVCIGGPNLSPESIHNIVTKAASGHTDNVVKVNQLAYYSWLASEFYAGDMEICAQKDLLITYQIA